MRVPFWVELPTTIMSGQVTAWGRRSATSMVSRPFLHLTYLPTCKAKLREASHTTVIIKIKMGRRWWWWWTRRETAGKTHRPSSGRSRRAMNTAAHVVLLLSSMYESLWKHCFGCSRVTSPPRLKGNEAQSLFYKLCVMKWIFFTVVVCKCLLLLLNKGIMKIVVL